jgi:hypothetical protein
MIYNLLGIFSALGVSIGGLMIYWQKQRYTKDVAETRLFEHENEEHHSFLSQIIKKMLNK